MAIALQDFPSGTRTMTTRTKTVDSTNRINFTPTPEQEACTAAAVKHIQAGQPTRSIDDILTLSGYAGTGKTSLIHLILASLAGRRVAVVAYTGKAASVLRSKGVNGARTIHATIYAMIEEEIVDKDTGKKTTIVSWGRKAREDIEADAFIIDEASMVGKEILDDLIALGMPIVAIGDSAQLPPISKYDVNLMADPDMFLTQIHRQAEGNSIIELATRLRTEKGFATRGISAMETDDLQIIGLPEVRRTEADVFICGFNKTRANMNLTLRNRMGFSPQEPFGKGERIICLSNDRELGVFNGLMGTIAGPVTESMTTIYPRGQDPVDVATLLAPVMWDGAEKERITPMSTISLGTADKIDWGVSMAHYARLAVVDYGHCITCHKSQGSEWDRVSIINEAMPKLWDQDRWLYTAVTRAAKYLSLGHRNA
jgi:exodeoxyribonuclease-5